MSKQMKAELTKLVTRYNQNKLCHCNGTIVQFDFTLYKCAIHHYVLPFESPYGTLQGLVAIPSYGFITREVTVTNDEISFREWNTGPLSERYSQVEGLIYFLCQIIEPSIEKINSTITRREKKWFNQRCGVSPYEKIAQKKLLKSYRHVSIEMQCEVPNPSSKWGSTPLQAMERMKSIWNQ
jgi:hypothetical protein